MYDLYNVDCIKAMKNIEDQSIDLILTDPPYNISKKNNWATMDKVKTGIDFGEWDKGFDLIGWLDEVPRILSKNGSVIIFNDWKKLGTIADKLEELGLVVKDCIRWIKPNPMPKNINRRYVVDYEFALWATNKKAKWTYNRQDPRFQKPEFVYPFVIGKERCHPTQKPVKLMEDLIRIHSNQGDLILDPFAGSGSTGVACMNTGRRFIGMELETKYFEIAKQRIDEAAFSYAERG